MFVAWCLEFDLISIIIFPPFQLRHSASSSSNSGGNSSGGGSSLPPPSEVFRNLRRSIEDEWEVLFMRAEGIHAHGYQVRILLSLKKVHFWKLNVHRPLELTVVELKIVAGGKYFFFKNIYL